MLSTTTAKSPDPKAWRNNDYFARLFKKVCILPTPFILNLTRSVVIQNQDLREKETTAQGERDSFGKRVEQDLADGPLIKALANSVSGDDLAGLFRSDSPGLFHLATSLINKNIQDSAFLNTVADVLQRGEQEVYPLLRVLASVPLPPHARLEQALIRCARSERTSHQEAATKVLCFRYPKRTRELLDNLNGGICNGLCYSGDVRYIEPLLRYWNVEESEGPLPPALGLLISSQWLANCLRERPELAVSLGRAYGFLDDKDDFPQEAEREAYAQLFERGFTIATSAMARADIDHLLSLEQHFAAKLLPWSLGMSSNGFSTVSNDILDVEKKEVLDTFLSAVRRVERENLEINRDEEPYAPDKRDNIQWARVCHTPYSYTERMLITTPLQAAQQHGVDSKFFGDVLIEHGNFALEHDFRLRTEAELFFETRWRYAGLTGTRPEAIQAFPIKDSEDMSFAADIVLPKPPVFSETRVEEGLSPAAKVLTDLTEYVGGVDISKEVQALEQHYSSKLLTVGCEIQMPIPAERKSDSLAWKQALRTFGIPSPRRPEYKWMVEASLPPSHSYHLQVATILGLRSLGMFQGDCDMALHVSLGGELGDNVRYLLFPQQFLTPATRIPITSRLLSKGIAHVNHDAQDVEEFVFGKKGESKTRTELRSMRISSTTMLLRDLPSFADDIAALQLLGTASISTDPELRQIWDRYTAKIDAYSASLPAVFGELLNADWYEATGEPYDSKLMELIPIYRARKAAKLTAQLHHMRYALSDSFREIRNEAVSDIRKILGAPAEELHILSHTQPASSAADYYIPEFFLERPEGEILKLSKGHEFQLRAKGSVVWEDLHHKVLVQIQQTFGRQAGEVISALAKHYPQGLNDELMVLQERFGLAGFGLVMKNGTAACELALEYADVLNDFKEILTTADNVQDLPALLTVLEEEHLSDHSEILCELCKIDPIQFVRTMQHLTTKDIEKALPLLKTILEKARTASRRAVTYIPVLQPDEIDVAQRLVESSGIYAADALANRNSPTREKDSELFEALRVQYGTAFWGLNAQFRGNLFQEEERHRSSIEMIRSLTGQGAGHFFSEVPASSWEEEGLKLAYRYGPAAGLVYKNRKIPCFQIECEPEYRNIVDLNQEHYGLDWIHRYSRIDTNGEVDTKLLYQNIENLDLGHKRDLPLALCICAKTDPLDSFGHQHFYNFLNDLSSRYKLLIYEAANKEEIDSLIAKVGEQHGRLDLLMLAAHGDSHRTQWSGLRHVPMSEEEKPKDDQFLSAYDIMLYARWRKFLKDGADAILYSCRAFSQADDAGGLGSTIQAMYPQVQVRGMRHVGILADWDFHKNGRLRNMYWRSGVAERKSR